MYETAKCMTFGKSSMYIRTKKLVKKLILVRKGYILTNMSKGFEKELKTLMV